jgi:hypothetical protein
MYLYLGYGRRCSRRLGQPAYRESCQPKSNSQDQDIQAVTSDELTHCLLLWKK